MAQTIGIITSISGDQQVNAALAGVSRSINDVANTGATAQTKLTGAFAGISDRVTGLGARFKELGSQLTSVIGQFGPLAGAFSAAGIVNFTTRTIALADDLGDLAERLHIGTDALQALQFEAEKAGIGAGSLQTALQVLNRQIGDARTGSKEAQEAFANLGISLTDASGKAKTNEQILNEVTIALGNIDDTSVRASRGADIFSKSFQEVGVVLDGTKGSLEQTIQRAKDLHVILDADLIKSAGETQEKFDILTRQITVFAQELALRTQPMIESTIREFQLLGQAIQGVVGWVQSLGDNTTHIESLKTQLAALQQQRRELANEPGLGADPDAIQQSIKAIDQRIAALQREIRSAEEARAVYDDLGRARAAADTAGGTFGAGLSAGAGTGVSTPAPSGPKTSLSLTASPPKKASGNISKTADALSNAINSVSASTADAAAVSEFYWEQLAKTNQQMVEFKDTADKTAEDVNRRTADLTTGFITFGQTLTSVLSDGKFSLQDFASVALSVLPTIIKLLGGIGGGGGGIFGAIGSLFGFASGGSFVTHSPQLIAVGENGPERVSVSPLTGGPDMRGNGSTVYYIDARGSNGDAAVEAAVQRGIRRATPGIVGLSVQTVSSRRQRDPLYLR